MSEEPEKQEKVTKKFASNAKVSDKTKVKPKFPACCVCQQILWNCVVLKNANQRAKFVAEQKLPFVLTEQSHFS